MAWPAGDAYLRSIARTEPGKGDWDDDRQQVPGTSIVKIKSIPGAPTGRLQRCLAVLHGMVHTVDGLREHDAPRRNLIEQSMKTRAITHELRMRGAAPGDCSHCWGLQP
jgi:hypothetical protein